MDMVYIRSTIILHQIGYTTVSGWMYVSVRLVINKMESSFDFTDF